MSMLDIHIIHLDVHLVTAGVKVTSLCFTMRVKPQVKTSIMYSNDLESYEAYKRIDGIMVLNPD